MNTLEELDIDKDTEQILLDLLGVYGNITNNEYSDYDGEIRSVEFFIQDGSELIPLWYIRRQVIRYPDGDKLHVVFRPNLKKKRIKPAYLRTAPERPPIKERGFKHD